MSKEKEDQWFIYRLGALLAIFVFVACFVGYVLLCEPTWFLQWRDAKMKEWNISNPFVSEAEVSDPSGLSEEERHIDRAACESLENMEVMVTMDQGLGNAVRVSSTEQCRPEVFTEIGHLKFLNALHADSVGVPDEYCAHLANLKLAQSVVLSGNPLTSGALVHIAQMENISALYLANTQIDGTNLELIAALPKIKILDLSGTNLTDADMEKIAKNQTIEWLLVKNLDLSDAGARALLKMPLLRRLSILEGNQISEECRKQMKEESPQNLQIE
ncbi:MAG: hypothetical protein Q4D38_10005 [Planctomycetia bacterium]|nr:hypothetical protein [Planctomycetia bacterium]